MLDNKLKKAVFALLATFGFALASCASSGGGCCGSCGGSCGVEKSCTKCPGGACKCN